MKRYRYITCIFLVFSILLFSTIALAATRGVHVISRQGQSLYLYKDYQAVVVGVGDYTQGWPDLPGAVKDAREVASGLEAMGFKVNLILNPTSSQLKSALNDIAFGVGRYKDRALLFYFAGHGETLELADGTELGYIIPTDCPLKNHDPRGFDDKAVSMKEIEALALKVQSKHFLMAFDSCFSGSLFNLVRAAPLDITEKSAQAVRQFITAGEAGEQVPDKSTFKIVFLDGVRGEADLNGDGYVTGSELGMHLQNKVVNYTRGGQHPQYGKINNPKLDKGDFIFALKRSPHPEPPGGATPPLPPEPGGISDYDAVIREREANQKRWAEWQSRMEADFSRAGQYDQDERLKPEEKVKVWSEFLSSYSADNPSSTADEQLREEANVKRKHWQEFKVAMGVAPPVPSGEKAFTNSMGMKFVLIPAGTFTMGSPSNEPGRDSDETQHQVTISKPFYMQTTEVTQGQWREVMGNNPSYFKNCGDDCPVERVSWKDCQEFIRKLNQREGTDKYRLPTEAEWEYACRAGSTTRFCFGDDEGRLGEYAWYGSNSGGRTHSVGQKEPNAWGLYDMHGNVWEWCADWYGKYPAGHVTDPKGPLSGSFRVFRGGNWFYIYNDNARYCRSADRFFNAPDYRYDDIGFRLVR